MRRRPRRFFLYLLLRVVMGGIRMIPREWGLRFGRFCGRVAFRWLSLYRGKTLKHLEFVYGMSKTPEDLLRIGCRVFENLGETAVDVILFPTLTRKNLESWVRFDPEKLERVNRLLARGKGLIAISAHLGNWELVAGCLKILGYRGAVVGREIYYKPYDRILVALRRSVGVETLYRTRSPKKLLEVLGRGEILGLVPDQDVDNLDGIFVEFLGHPAYTPTAPAKLAIRTGAPILPCFIVRRGDRYQMILEEPIFPNREGDREDEIRRLTEAWSRAVESEIREFPEQWVWMHNRWKTQPKEDRGVLGGELPLAGDLGLAVGRDPEVVPHPGISGVKESRR